jgi:hypothetical protein
VTKSAFDQSASQVTVTISTFDMCNGRLSRGHELAKAIQYMLKRWPAFTLFLDDGRVCLNTPAAHAGC